MLGNNTQMLTFLWCIPRSISTAFEKMMSCSRQFKVVGEPFIDLYKRSLLLANHPLAMQQEFASVCERLLTQGLSEPVFVIDMAYHAYPFKATITTNVNNLCFGIGGAPHAVTVNAGLSGDKPLALFFL
jgi:hypothetical protein